MVPLLDKVFSFSHVTMVNIIILLIIIVAICLAIIFYLAKINYDLTNIVNNIKDEVIKNQIDSCDKAKQCYSTLCNILYTSSQILTYLYKNLDIEIPDHLTDQLKKHINHNPYDS